MKILRLVLSVLGFLIIAATAGIAVLHMPALDGVRSRIAAELLASYLGETVVVTGGVDLSYGQTIDVSVSGVAPAAVSAAQAQTLPVGTVRLSFARDAALRGRLKLTALDLSGVRVLIDAAASKRSGRSPGQAVSSAVETFLSSSLLRSLKLNDVRIVRSNDPAGWNGTLMFDTVVTSVSKETAGTIALDADGSLNDQAFRLSGSLPAFSASSLAEQGQDLALTLSVKGIEAKLQGSLTRTADGPMLSARLQAESSSIGDLQDLLELARVLEGAGSLSLELDGPLAKLAMGSAALRIETAGGHVYEARGGISNIWSVEGMDADFAATFALPDASAGKPGLDLTPRSIKGHLSGGGSGFEIDRVFIETGLASIQLTHVGPIRIGRIARDEDAHLRLEDIRLLQGDPKDPMLDLTGHLNDALELRGFSLAGRFRFEMAKLLTGRQDASGVGVLRGEVAMSDASGHLRFETLAAELKETRLMSLSLHLAKAAASDQQFGVELAVPDLDRLNAALGHDASPAVELAFDGTLAAGAGTAMIQGSGQIGETDFTGRLQIAVPEAGPEITGEISSKHLHLGDIAAAHQAADLVADRKVEAVQVREDMWTGTTLSLDIEADRVEGGDTTVGGLRASLEYAQSRLGFSVTHLSYLGGRITGALDADIAVSPPAIELQAAVGELSLEQLFARLGQAPLASGSLDLDIAVRTDGGDLGAMLAALSGRVSGQLSAGTLADRTINLAGQSIIEWVFTPSADGGAPIECLVARFDFDDGVGTVRRLVLETDKVQAAGGGSLDLRARTMDFVFRPRPKARKLIGQIGPVSISGPLSDPDIDLARGAVATKVVGDTIGLPFHLLRPILGADGRTLPDHEPCVLVPQAR